MLANPTGIPNASGAFTAMASLLSDYGGLTGGLTFTVAQLLMVSALASFMSTADSVLIAIANVFTQDLFVGWFQNYIPANICGL